MHPKKPNQALLGAEGIFVQTSGGGESAATEEGTERKDKLNGEGGCIRV